MSRLGLSKARGVLEAWRKWYSGPDRYVEQLIMLEYDHLVRVDDSTHQVVIYRVDRNGKKTLYTTAPLPENKAEFESFARQLGENLLLDCPVARRILGL